MTISESSITLDFPDSNYFRFQDCQGYKSLDNLKEMDACWYETSTDTLYLIELKDWGNANIDEENNPSISRDEIDEIKTGITKHRLFELWKKSVDSTSMFLSVLLDTPYSLQIKACVPFSISKKTNIKILSIINWTDTDISYLSNIHAEYKSKFKPFAKLFNIKAYVVMSKYQATQQYDWIK